MKKILAILFAFALLLLVINNHPVSATERYSVCDQCGWCITPNPDPAQPPVFPSQPQSWGECAKCLYDGANDTNKASILIPAANPTIPGPTPGRYYTGFGCISTNSDDFTKPGAAGQVVAPFLNIIFSVTGAIAFIYLIYGTFLILTSRGDYEQLNHGKRTVWGSVTGLIFVLTSVLLINFIGRGILRIPGFS